MCFLHTFTPRYVGACVGCQALPWSVIPLAPDLRFADILQMLLPSNVALVKESWAVRRLFCLGHAHHTIKALSNSNRMNGQGDLWVYRYSSAFLEAGCPEIPEGFPDEDCCLGKLGNGFTSVLGGYILPLRSVGEYVVAQSIINLEASVTVSFQPSLASALLGLMN